MKTVNGPFIYGFGAYAPEKILTNEELATFVDTSDEWIVSRTGIKTRHLVADDQINSDLATIAAHRAIERSGIQKEEITHIVLASCTPDSTSPPTSCLLAEKLNLPGRFALDINAACSGFVYGVEVARSLAIANPSAVILLVASDVLSRRSNWQDRSTCVLFGDAAGAVIISGEEGPKQTLQGRIEDVLLSSDGSLGALLEIKGGHTAHPYKLGDVVGPEYFVCMQGREVFKNAVRSMSAVSKNILEKNGLTVDDIDLLVPHQANMRIIEAVSSRLNAPLEKVFINVDKYGNTSAASVPLALSEAIDSGAIKPGMKVLLVTFGGGFTWGASLIQF